MPNRAVSVESLQRAAVDYQAAIRELPFYALQQVAAALKLNILSVKGTDKIIAQRRAGGLLRPYSPGLPSAAQSEILKYVEMALTPQEVFIPLSDNITNYKDKKVLSQAGEAVDHKTKKHPLEWTIIQAAIKTFNEDVVNSLFFGERVEKATTPNAAFNGFFTTLDHLTTAGYVSKAEKNLFETGAIINPTNSSDTDAYDKVLEFLLSANPFLRNGDAQLTISNSAILAALKAYKNKCRSHSDPKLADMIQTLRDEALMPGLNFATHTCLGTGSKLMLHKPGLLDIGRSPSNGATFCQVRSVKEDPNEIQFWIQDAFDTRIQDVHQKVFHTNEQTNTSIDLSGDYTPSAE